MYPDTAKYECSIPTGAAWDRTLGWIIETKDNGLGLSEVMYNSRGWGNYRDAEFNVTRGKFSIEDESNIFVYTAINGTHTKEKMNKLYLQLALRQIEMFQIMFLI